MSEEHYDLLTSNEAQIKAAAMEFRKQRAQNAGTLYTHKKCAGDCSTCTREKCLNMK